MVGWCGVDEDPAVRPTGWRGTVFNGQRRKIYAPVPSEARLRRFSCKIAIGLPLFVLASRRAGAGGVSGDGAGRNFKISKFEYSAYVQMVHSSRSLQVHKSGQSYVLLYTSIYKHVRITTSSTDYYKQYGSMFC